MRLVVPFVAAGVIALGLLGARGYDAVGAQSLQGDPNHGKYVFQIAACAGCHGADLSGWREASPSDTPATHPGEMFAGPFGRVPASNISQDKETGIGDWTDEQIADAIRDGRDKQGRQLFPVMPYGHLHFLSDQDTADLVAFLRTVPPVDHDVPERALNGPEPRPLSLPPSPAQAPTSGVERGAYLVNAMAGCGECHTAMGPSGSDMAHPLAGGGIPREDGSLEIAPNITPDQETGIGAWSEDEIVTLLKTGTVRGSHQVRGRMREVIENPPWGGFNQMTDQDAHAVAAYLKSIPAQTSTAPPSTRPAGPPAAQASPAAQPSPAARPASQPAAAPVSPVAPPAQAPRPSASPAVSVPGSLPRTGVASPSALPLGLLAGAGAGLIAAGIWLRRRR
jgi:mono/diheme cytochrome c family protein